MSLTNFGIDQNVFNDPVDASPKRDFTLTITPSTDLWLRLGRTWFTGNIKGDIIWFKQFASERATNDSYTLRWRVPLNRLVLRTGVTYANTRDRPGFEIDARAQRKELGYTGVVEVRALSKTFVALNASRQRVDFDRGAVFLNSNLQLELNRVSTTFGGSLRYQATALTTIAMNVSRIEDRFEFSSLRDSNSTAATVSVAFDPLALIKGTATFGYRKFQPLSPGLAEYNGATAAVNVFYTLLGVTRFSVLATRDVQYSYDVNQPYYLLTGGELSIAQQIFGPFDVVGRVGQQKLAYSDREGAQVQVSNRVDYVHTYGGGVGYHLGKDLRLGFNIDQSNRISDVSRRQYEDLKFGSSLTYGF
jgi:hypothetical protein